MPLANLLQGICVFAAFMKCTDLTDPAFHKQFLRLIQMRAVCDDHFRMQTVLDLSLPLRGELRIDQCIESSGINNPEEGGQCIRPLLHEDDHRPASCDTAGKGTPCAAAQIKKPRAGILLLTVRHGNSVRSFSCCMFKIFQYIRHVTVLIHMFYLPAYKAETYTIAS